MAHYIGPQITLGEFVARAISTYQAHEFHDKFMGPRGPVRRRNLHRVVNSAVKIAHLPDIADDDALTYTVLHSLCRDLAIPPDDFGVPLDLTFISSDPDDEDDD